MPVEILSHALPGHLIRRLHQQSTQAFQRGMERAGVDLTPVQFALLDAVLAAPGLDQAAAADAIACDRATTGGVVERLERRGLLTRAVSPRDRRARELRATDAGIRVMEIARPAVVALQDDILAGLPPADRAAFVDLARRAVAPTPPVDGTAEPAPQLPRRGTG